MPHIFNYSVLLLLFYVWAFNGLYQRELHKKYGYHANIINRSLGTIGQEILKLLE